jgi:uncharacterized repeat protein (TIGR03803 family)
MLAAAVLPMIALSMRAQVTFTNLHSFDVFINGRNPAGALVAGSDGSFYGTTAGGGTNGGHGTVFKISANGVITSLYSFTGGVDGNLPSGALVMGSDGNFYGTTFNGGTNGEGTIFKISPTGSFLSLYSFSVGTDGGNNVGGNPNAALVQGSDGNFYGTTSGGGTNGDGTVFMLGSNGAFRSLYSFTNGIDGASPEASLVQGSDGDFYGTTHSGGKGTIFKISAGGTFTLLHSFTNGVDGANPQGALVQGSDGSFYGTTYSGGSKGEGTIFKISAGGTFTLLHSFTNGVGGAYPQAGLVQTSDGDFYGTTSSGGAANGYGIVFKISASGAFTALYSFQGGAEGQQPEAALVQGTGDIFYGMTVNGGTDGDGTIFKISSAGTFTPLYSFTGGADDGEPSGLVQGSDGDFYGTTQFGEGTVFKISANGTLTPLHSFVAGDDGEDPEAGLVKGSDGDFYGTTYSAGSNGVGIVFKISAGGAFTPLYSFTGDDGGKNPEAGLVQGSDGSFYGTTQYGGTNGDGTVFVVSSSGAFTSLYSFTGTGGREPEAGLVQGSDGDFYGITYFGGSNSYGTVFKISAGGTFALLHSFNNGADGAYPAAALVQGSDGNFYGTTTAGGTNGGYGTVFKISTAGMLTPLHSFAGGSDGSVPQANLVQGSDGNFYGTTEAGGMTTETSPQGFGTVFKITASGALTQLYSFTGGNNGEEPETALVQSSDGSFYGTTYSGGEGKEGIVFSLTVGQSGLVPSVSILINPALGFTNGIFGFDVSAPMGSRVVIQTSTNLQDWTPQQTNLMSSNLLYFSDPQPSAHTQRFYRAVLPQ